MGGSFRDWEHLLRVALLALAGVAIFLVLRALLVPEGFGDLGHFRAGALTDISAAPTGFAGREACAECHVEVVEARAGSAHAAIGCEACHGPLAAHAADPGAATPTRPEAEPLCRSCHAALVGRPAGFPQVDPDDHAAGEPCGSCHEAHHPEL